MSEYREIRGSLQGERCEHKSWADLCERCEIDRFRAENEKLRAALARIENEGDGALAVDLARAALSALQPAQEAPAP